MVIDYKEYSQKLTEKMKKENDKGIINKKNIKMGTKLLEWLTNDKIIN